MGLALALSAVCHRLRVSPVVSRIGNLSVRSLALAPGCVFDPTLAAFASDSITLHPDVAHHLTPPHHFVDHLSSSPRFYYHLCCLTQLLRIFKMSEQEKSSSGEGEQAKKITMEQLQAHDKTGDLWLLMDGKGRYHRQSIGMPSKSRAICQGRVHRSAGQWREDREVLPQRSRSVSVADAVDTCQCLTISQSTMFRSSWTSTQEVTRSW